MFFGTLGTVHGPMAKIKSDCQKALSNRFMKDYDNVRKNLTSTDPDIGIRIKNIIQVYELHKITDSFPVWPFDFVSIRKFLTVYLSPFIFGITINVPAFFA